MNSTQNYGNHRRLVKGYHVLLFFLLTVGLIGSVVNLVASFNNSTNLYSASLICLLFMTVSILAYYARVFALKAQDRAIKAEENFRFFVLTGKPLDKRLRTSQIIALRFAADTEIVELAIRAAEENLSNKEIKLLIKEWRPDFHRV
ncbi:DUF6526 family protein [Solitalea lacus]|uniref:DUF6526 family protein n=1 Tax=Solitalea lacus TaxID=2911172 RepID=UPI001EDA2E69|nr:DUF6526 family protein [Solitalea lacus]UKJ05951.1 DUF6526 family protein [Solitalea lacus]